MQYLWTGEPPERPVPKFPSLTVEGASGKNSVRLIEGDLYQAEVTFESAGNNSLSYR